MSKTEAVLQNLPQQYQTLVKELEEVDIKMMAKHASKFNAFKEFSNLIELGIDIAERRKELTDATDNNGYGAKLVSTFSAVLGVAESTIFHATKSVEVLGKDYLRQLAVDAQNQGIKLTMAHIRELNRLDSQDWAENRLAIIAKIFDGTINTSREVRAEVDNVLGVKRTTVTYGIDDDDEPATAPKKKDQKDALDDLASAADIDVLCVQLIDLIQQFNKKFEKISTAIKDWREDVTFETMSSMVMDNVDIASEAVTDFCTDLKDTGLLLDDVIKSVTAAAAEV